jgi:hypothetical protein
MNWYAVAALLIALAACGVIGYTVAAIENKDAP